jgi:hypothetical protein
MRTELKQILQIFAAWILLSVALFLLVPWSWWTWWILLIPIALIIIAVVATMLLVILYKYPIFKPIMDRFVSPVATINHKPVKACSYCPHSKATVNPWNKTFPIYKCEDAGLRTIYNPAVVPRWCPYVSK